MKPVTTILLAAITVTSQAQTTVLQHVNIISGTGAALQTDKNIVIAKDRIAAITPATQAPPKNAALINMQGKTVMPAIISAHSHVGNLKGNTASGANYTRENIFRQLNKYEDYGVGAVLCMGTDRPLIFNGLRDSSVQGLLPGARFYSAGYGFAAKDGGPAGMDGLNRPVTPGEAIAAVDEMAKLKPTVLKIWVDDFGGTVPKMAPEIYKAIIQEAHKKGIRVASHLYYLADAHSLVDAGVDIIAHSVRDKDIDDELLQKMKQRGVVYIPTLSLDEYAYIYARKPEWINDDFFKASLEPGVYDMITSQQYQDNIKNSAAYEKNKAAFETALRNVKKVYDAGILVALGTDSGANPVRTQGFSEHLEMELLTQAGLTPLQAITIATHNAATALRSNKDYGTIETGKKADFIVLAANPLNDIKNTRSITAVYKNGQQVSGGPLAK